MNFDELPDVFACTVKDREICFATSGKTYLLHSCPTNATWICLLSFLSKTDKIHLWWNSIPIVSEIIQYYNPPKALIDMRLLYRAYYNYADNAKCRLGLKQLTNGFGAWHEGKTDNDHICEAMAVYQLYVKLRNSNMWEWI